MSKAQDQAPNRAGVIILHQGLVLMCKDSANKTWVLPKGHIEQGESPAIAAIREAWEETGFLVGLDAKLGMGGYDILNSDETVKESVIIQWFIGRDVASKGFMHAPSWKADEIKRETCWVSPMVGIGLTPFKDMQEALAMAEGWLDGNYV